jgi:hypothetical protein
LFGKAPKLLAQSGLVEQSLAIRQLKAGAVSELYHQTLSRALKNAFLISRKMKSVIKCLIIKYLTIHCIDFYLR